MVLVCRPDEAPLIVKQINSNGEMAAEIGVLQLRSQGEHSSDLKLLPVFLREKELCEI